jgi:outer membrane protein TolC
MLWDTRYHRCLALLASRMWAPRRGMAAILLGIVLAVTPAVAQQIPSPLSLADALRLARENNPAFLTARNDAEVADWQVREAYGAFLPTVSAAGAISYQEPGVQTYGTVNLATQTTGYSSSRYSLGVNWRLDGNTIFGVPSARAARRATEAGIEARSFGLEAQVTLQYMETLRAGDALEVARAQLDRVRQNLDIVRTRVATGAAAGTEGKQAEVESGRAQVEVIRAEQRLRVQTLRLMEVIGLPLGGAVELVREFEIFEPTWTVEELVSLAEEGHPALVAAEASEGSTEARARQARSQYFPSLSINTGWYGFTNQALNEAVVIAGAERNARAAYENCSLWLTIQNELGTELPGLDLGDGCGSPMLSEAQRRAVLNSNDVFPFDFTKSPLSVTASLSIPIFTGFSRQRSIEAAAADAKDAEYAHRAEVLRVRSAVTEAHAALGAAWEVVRIEERNVELAEERLEASRLRYSMGAAPAASVSAGSTFLELLDAEASLSTAERDHLNAVYDFHQSLAQLEEATGQRLTPRGVGEN